jgi:hypothetical protein
VISVDPIDNNFTQFAQPIIIQVMPSLAPGTPDLLAKEYNALASTQQYINGISQALYTTLNRIMGANAAGNTEWLNKQTSYAENLEARIAALSALVLLRKIKGTLIATGGDTTITAAQVQAFESQLASTGLPPLFISTLNILGITDTGTLNTIKNLLIVQDPNAAAGSLSSIIANTSLLASLENTVFSWGGQCALVLEVAAAIGTRAGDPGFTAMADPDNDGVIDQRDFGLARAQTGAGNASCNLGDVNQIRPVW